jgi:hypothetical protein
MKRSIRAFAAGLVVFAAGLVTWLVVVSVLDRGLRAAIAGYAAAEPTLHFTVGMMAARLTIAAVTSLLAGAVIGWLAPANLPVAWILGALLLAVFLPEHVLKLWHTFPLWYHLTFLGTLVPLVVLGAQLTRASASRRLQQYDAQA